MTLVANGDLRLSANQTCRAAQHDMEATSARALQTCSYELNRANPSKEERPGFISPKKDKHRRIET
jgi:hypothetical protein